MHITINGSNLNGYPKALEVTPSQTVYSGNCVIANMSNGRVAGTAITFNIQSRDYFSNNKSNLLSTLKSYKIEMSLKTDSSINFTGTLADKSGDAGVY